MKSIFLQKLSSLLIPDKETDYIDFYNLQTIKNWPLFAVIQNSIKGDDDFFIIKKVEDQSKHDKNNINLLGLEYSELISFDENNLIIDAGGEFQGLHRVNICLDDSNDLFIFSCEVVPELTDSLENLISRHSEEDYSLLLDQLQEVLENQD